MRYLNALLHIYRLLDSFSHASSLKKSTVIVLLMKMFNQWLFCFSNFVTVLINIGTVEPRFNEVAGARPNLFVKWRVNDITNLRGNNQNVCYIEVIVND